MAVLVDFARNPRAGVASGVIFVPSQITAGANWYKVRFGNGTFVSINNGGIANCIGWSNLGYIWNIVAGSAALQWTGLAYGEGVWVKVAQNGVGNQIGRSTDDGKTWSPIAEPSNRQWRDVCYCGANTFFAVAQDGAGNQFMRSTDLGLTWASVAEPSTRIWKCVWCNVSTGTVVALAQDGVGNQIARSNNRGAAGSWASIAEPINQVWQGITFGNNIWLGVGTSVGAGNHLMRSNDDGLTWSAFTGYANVDAREAAWGFDRFSIVINDGATALTRVLVTQTSYNTQVHQWSSYYGMNLNSICFGWDRFVAVGTGTVTNVMVS